MLKLNFKLAVLLAAALIGFGSSAAFAQEAFVIDQYNINVEVGTDRVYQIREQLQVDFSKPRHGIIRSIPSQSSVEAYKIRDIKVEGAPYSTDQGSQMTNITIGDEDKMVDGVQDYRISYKLVHCKDDATDGDYAYITLIGTQWDTTIKQANIQVHFPTDAIQSVNVTTGRQGEAGQDAQYTVDGNNLRITAQDLDNYEGITVMVKMPEGTFYAAPDSFYPNAGKIIAALLGLAVLALVVTGILFFKYGRDKTVVPVVEFYPPEERNPAEIGYIIDQDASARDASSLIFYWASKGLLNYEQTDKDEFVLYKQRDMDSTAPAYEKHAFQDLWKYGQDGVVSSKQLEHKYYTTVQYIQRNVPKQFTGEKELEEKKSARASWTGVFLSMIAPCLLILGGTTYAGMEVVTAFVLFAVSAAVEIGFYLLQYHQQSSVYKHRGASRAVQGICIAAALAFSVFYPKMIDWENVFDWRLKMALYILSFAGIFWAVYIHKRSAYGQEILERTVGFKEFLETAEKEKLETLLEENSSYFFDLLPYALVLNVTDAWAKKFDGIAVQPPQWYHSYDQSTFSTIVLYHHMIHAMNRTQAQLTSVPQQAHVSSGSFGGGGFSGGGSGGGGGSSW